MAATALLVFKLVVEALTGSLLFPVDLRHDVRPIPIAHLAGALCGLLCVIITVPKGRSPARA